MTFVLGPINVRKRSRLPHWDVQHGIHAMTTHLGDALPLDARLRIRDRMDAEIAAIRATKGDLTEAERTAILQRYYRRLNGVLDRGYGACVLRDQRAAQIVANSLMFFDGERYGLFSWSVMPNHFHAVFHCIAPWALDDIVHGWKSYTSHETNKCLGREGNLWEEDYWDTTIRNERHFRAANEYVLNNPAKAGLTNWPFTRAYPERIAQVLR